MYQIRIYYITNDGEFTYHIYNDYDCFDKAYEEYVIFMEEFAHYKVEDYLFIPKIVARKGKFEIDMERITRILDEHGKILVTIHEEEVK